MRSAGIPIESLIEYVRLFALGRQTVPARMAILLEERKNLADRIAQMQEVLSRLGADEEDVEGLYSVSQKAGEPGILAYCRRRRIPYRTFRPEELQAVPGHFAASELVLRTVGTDNVCERAAVKGSGMGLLLAGKTAVGPVTAAAAQRKRGIWF